MEYHLMPIRMAITLQKIQEITSVRMWRKENPHTLLVGM